MENSPDGKNVIARKMTQVMGEIQAAPMSGKHHHSYRYHTREDAFAVRPALVRHGIATTTRSRILSVDNQKIAIEVECDFICTDTGQTITASAVGQGQDKQDQGASKAQTNAIKNLFLNTFLLGSEQHTGYSQPKQHQPKEDPSKAIAALEDVLVANVGLSAEEASEYINGHVAKHYGKGDITQARAGAIRAFTEKLQNGLQNNHDKVIRKIIDTIANGRKK